MTGVAGASVFVDCCVCGCVQVGKLSLYTVCAGMPPQYCLPVTIDVGTDTAALLTDDMYIGLRQPRDRSDKYDALIDEFIHAAIDR